MTKHELHQKDMVITPLIFQGQSPYQIITNHPELDMSVRTLYSYLDGGILFARNIDLKRQVKIKPRKIHKTQIKDRTIFDGRMFSDFQALELDHFAEMDTVHSSQDSKRVILTFFLTREKLFLSQPRIKNDALCFDITDKIVVDVNVPFLVIVHGIAFADLDFLNQPHQRRTV